MKNIALSILITLYSGLRESSVGSDTYYRLSNKTEYIARPKNMHSKTQLFLAPLACKEIFYSLERKS